MLGSQGSTEWHFGSPRGSHRGLSGNVTSAQPAISSAQLLVEVLPETPDGTISSPLRLPCLRPQPILCLLVYPAKTQSHDWVLGPHDAKWLGGRYMYLTTLLGPQPHHTDLGADPDLGLTLLDLGPTSPDFQLTISGLVKPA